MHFLKKLPNVENFQTGLNLQQTYSTALCSHVNNIYNKLVEIQWQLAHSNLHMNIGDMIQIEVSDFDPDIDEALPLSTDQFTTNPETQGSDWLDTIPVEIPPQPKQDTKHGSPTLPAQHITHPAEIPHLEKDFEVEQYQDLETYLTHHNMHKESQHINRDYREKLLQLDDDRYYQEIDRAYQTYKTLPAQDYIPANQAPSPCRTTQELMQIVGKGRDQAHREELHGHRPFRARTRSLQSCIQRKIKKTQWMRQRYANAQ